MKLVKSESSEAATGGVLWEKVFLKKLQYSQKKHLCLFLIKLQTFSLKTPILMNICKRLLLKDYITESFSHNDKFYR